VWLADEDRIINVDLDEADVPLRARIEAAGVPLATLANVRFGIKLYETGKGTPPQTPEHARGRVYESAHKAEEDYRPYLEGKDVDRYATRWASRWLKYGPCLAAPRDPTLFEGRRLLVRRIVGERLLATVTDEDYVTGQLLQIVKPVVDYPAPEYLLGILNSRLLKWYFLKRYNRRDKTFPEIRVYELEALPIRRITLGDAADVAKHDRMVSLVQTMLDLHKSLQEANTPSKREIIERQIDATDHQIDTLVYDLYGLTPAEIAIVESNG
jgi:hypothetical protein